MDRRASASHAAVILAVLLACIASASEMRPLSPCENAREWRRSDGWTTSVRCSAERDEVESAAIHEPGLRGPARLLFGLPLDLNRADARALEVLPGIGPARAQAIVAARGAGRFRSVHELKAIPGIGPVTVSRLEGWVQVEPGSNTPESEELR